MSNATPVEVTKEEEAGQQQNWLFQAVNDLFAVDPGNTITLQSGQVVEVRTAKVKTLREITQLVQQFLAGYSAEEIGSLVSMTSRAQEMAVNEGGDPFKEALGRIKGFTGGVQLIAKVTETGAAIAPKLMEKFTNLTADEFDDLPLEEGAIVAYSVFGRNYHFFSQQVRPAIAAFIALRAKQAQTTKES